MEGGEADSHGNVRQFLQEAYCMVFKDSYSPFATAMEDAFNNRVKSTIESRKFIQSTDVRALYLKNEILYSAKLAMHLCMDKFVMADFDIEEGQDLEVSDPFWHAKL